MSCFKQGDIAELQIAKKDLKEILKAKRDYKNKLETKTATNNLGSAWDSMKNPSRSPESKAAVQSPWMGSVQTPSRPALLTNITIV